MTEVYHIPVLANESVAALNIQYGHDVVDATFGGGGHSRIMLEHLGNGRLFAFDQDEDAAGNAMRDDRLFFIRHNFRYIKNFLRYYNVSRVDSIFADLGVSSHDFDVPERGFSFRFNGRLDMRMNRDAQLDAAAIVNTYSAEQLFMLFKMYGEIRNAKCLVNQIEKERAKSKIETTSQLKKIAVKCTQRAQENKFLAQVFQALRIEVNAEMDALKEFLMATTDLLEEGGRLVVITYHSLEDRLCKNFMRTGRFDGKVEKDFYGNVESPFKLVNRKVITPGETELRDNPRSRSAKLRIAERI
jgi:16S rRNA (cytosine1402-N4)-methyltransferase